MCDVNLLGPRPADRSPLQVPNLVKSGIKLLYIGLKASSAGLMWVPRRTDSPKKEAKGKG